MMQTASTPIDFRIRHGFEDIHRPDAARLFWSAFRRKLVTVMSPERKALALFRNIVKPDFAISAVDARNRLLGIAGFKTPEGSFTGGTLADMQNAYGKLGGVWRGMVLELLERDCADGVLLMDGIFVDSRARGQGIGTALLHAVADEARARGLQAVRLDVIDENISARRLYEREGFRAVRTHRLGPLSLVFGFREATQMQLTL